MVSNVKSNQFDKENEASGTNAMKDDFSRSNILNASDASDGPSAPSAKNDKNNAELCDPKAAEQIEQMHDNDDNDEFRDIYGLFGTSDMDTNKNRTIDSVGTDFSFLNESSLFDSSEENKNLTNITDSDDYGSATQGDLNTSNSTDVMIETVEKLDISEPSHNLVEYGITGKSVDNSKRSMFFPYSDDSDYSEEGQEGSTPNNFNGSNVLDEKRDIPVVVDYTGYASITGVLDLMISDGLGNFKYIHT